MIGFMVSRFSWPCSHELSYKSFIYYDVEFSVCLVLRVLVFHPLRCDLTVVRFDAVV
jgi:hypothetical protein